MYDDQTPQGTTHNVYVQQGPGQAGNGLAVASLVLGILSILFVWIPLIGMISWILAPLGLVLGLVGLNKPTGRGMAIAGAVCSGVGLLGCIGWVVLFGAAAAAGAGAA
ncbi:MAG TPA: hypothetical protein VEA15_09520 [Caulobacteraceae bacterium]|nr:hypothetical protein [Caulobacteraceae bacterium]